MRRTAQLLALLSLTACSERTLRAVTGASCRERPEQAACAAPRWPNQHSSANSDEWLEAHGASLRELRPTLLLLNFHNALSNDEARALAERQIEALAEGSRYHGYDDPDAPAFLKYQLEQIVDLTDSPPPAGWQFSSSSRVPLDERGAFDVAALFGDEFSALIGRSDPDDATRMLGLCEQFERGLINEVWLSVGDEKTGREPSPMIECKASRAADGKRDFAGSKATVGGDVCARLPACGVTVRIAHLSPLRDPGCDLLVRGWALRGSLQVIPYLARNATRFMNGDLDRRYGAPVPNLLKLCGEDDNPCLRYPTPSSLECVLPRGPSFRVEDYGQGCGTPEFPSNARFMWDWQNTIPVNSSCEHYGLQDGPNGADLTTSYSADRITAYAEKYRECGGGWQIYWRQSMPGLDNHALAEDGSAMLNWWPFLFY